MKRSLCQELREVSRQIASAEDGVIAGLLNGGLNRCVGPRFTAITAAVRDSSGQGTNIFGTLITTSSAAPSSGTEAVADSVACAIDVCGTLDLEGLREAYRRIAEAKRLKKAPRGDKSESQTNVTLGIILAARASVPLDVLSEELHRLNLQTPSVEWPSMVVILNWGTISYAAHFPGEQEVSDFLPPAEDALGAHIPPLYIAMVICPAVEHTLSKMCGFLMAHLFTFCPGAPMPDWAELRKDVPKTVITITGYQYNLADQLVPVPRELYNDRYLPPSPILIEDGNGKILSTVQFVPWQEGGVILLRGQLPLDGLLVFLGKGALKSGIIRRGDLQLSHVLPITRADFDNWLLRIQQRSSFVVKQNPAQMVVQKIADEGMSTPVMARLFMEILRLRDPIFLEPAKRIEFDEAYRFVLMEVLNVRTTARNITKLWDEHVRKVSQGEVAGIQARSIHIDECIDQPLNKEVQSFVNGAVRVLKHGMQKLTKMFGMDLGFLFQRPTQFATGLKALEKTDPVLAAYLKQVRLMWSERLMDQRNAIEHDGWQLPKTTYSSDAGVIRVDEPKVSGQKAGEFVAFMLDRLLCFVEEVTVHCLQANMPQGVSVTETFLAQRTTDTPGRFQLTPTTGGMPIWRLTYPQSSFEGT